MGIIPDEGDGLLTGDAAFIDELDKTLALASDDQDANERLWFFYTALGLGFTGPYFKPIPEHQDTLRAYMDKMFPRVRSFLDASDESKITPEAYRFTDKRNFVVPNQDRNLVIILAVLFLGATLLVGYFLFYGVHKSELEKQVRDVLETQINQETE